MSGPSNPHQTLTELLLQRSVRTGKFKLASGRESDWFIDCKQAVLSAEGHAASARLLLKAVSERFPEAEAVAGVALGGCPLASGVSLLSSMTEFRNLPALYVRKERKDHGSAQLVEGTGSVEAGSKVVLLEDVTTSGGSSLGAVRSLREAGYEVLGVIALVDRAEGAEEAFQEAGVPFHAVLNRDNLVPRPK